MPLSKVIATKHEACMLVQPVSERIVARIKVHLIVYRRIGKE